MDLSKSSVEVCNFDKFVNRITAISVNRDGHVTLSILNDYCKTARTSLLLNR